MAGSPAAAMETAQPTASGPDADAYGGGDAEIVAGSKASDELSFSYNGSEMDDLEEEDDDAESRKPQPAQVLQSDRPRRRPSQCSKEYFRAVVLMLLQLFHAIFVKGFRSALLGCRHWTITLSSCYVAFGHSLLIKALSTFHIMLTACPTFPAAEAEEQDRAGAQRVISRAGWRQQRQRRLAGGRLAPAATSAPAPATALDAA